MHLPKHKLCIRKMELAPKMIEISSLTEFTWPWQQMLTNWSDIRYVIPQHLHSMCLAINMVLVYPTYMTLLHMPGQNPNILPTYFTVMLGLNPNCRPNLLHMLGQNPSILPTHFACLDKIQVYLPTYFTCLDEVGKLDGLAGVQPSWWRKFKHSIAIARTWVYFVFCIPCLSCSWFVSISQGNLWTISAWILFATPYPIAAELQVKTRSPVTRMEMHMTTNNATEKKKIAMAISVPSISAKPKMVNIRDTRVKDTNMTIGSEASPSVTPINNAVIG